MRNKPLLVILLTILIDMIGIGILIPVMPQLLANPDSPHYLLDGAHSARYGFVLLGALAAAYPLMSFISAPILGQLSDRYGRRKVLAVCLAGTAFGYALFSIGILLKSIPLLFISRIIDGITGGNISVAQASIADISKPEERAKNFGLMGAMFGLGFILGPVLGGKLADPNVVSWFNATTPFWLAAILALVNLGSVLLFFPETHSTDAASKAFRWLSSLTDIGRAWRWVELRTLFIVSFFFTVGFSFFISFYNVFLTERFGYTEGQIGNYFGYVGLFIVLGNALLTGLVAKRWSSKQVLKVSLLGTSLTVLATAFVQAEWQLWLIPPFMAASNALSFANIGSTISQHAGPDRQGEIMGMSASIGSLASALPPMLAGLIAATFSPVATIVVGAGICLFAWATYMRVSRTLHKAA